MKKRFTLEDHKRIAKKLKDSEKGILETIHEVCKAYPKNSTIARIAIKANQGLRKLVTKLDDEVFKLGLPVDEVRRIYYTSE